MKTRLWFVSFVLWLSPALAGEWSVLGVRQESREDRRYVLVDVEASEVFPGPLHFVTSAEDKEGKRITTSFPRTTKLADNARTIAVFISEKGLAEHADVVFSLKLSTPGFTELVVTVPVAKEKPSPAAGSAPASQP